MTSMKRALMAAATFGALTLGTSDVLAEPYRGSLRDKNVAGKTVDGVHAMEGRRLAQVSGIEQVSELKMLKQLIEGTLDHKTLRPDDMASLRNTALRVIGILRNEVKKDPWETIVKKEFKDKDALLDDLLGKLKRSIVPVPSTQPSEFGGAENLDRYALPLPKPSPLKYLAADYRRGIFLGLPSVSDEFLEAFNLRGKPKDDSTAFLTRALNAYLSGKPTADDAKALGSMIETTINHSHPLYQSLSAKDPTTGKSLLERLNSGDPTAVNDLFKKGLVQGVLSPTSQMLVARRFPFDYKLLATELMLEFRAPKGYREFLKQMQGLSGTDSFHFIGADLGFNFATIRSFLELESLTPGALKLPTNLLTGTGYNAEGVFALNFGGKVGSRIWTLTGKVSGGYNSVDFELPSALIANQSAVFFTGKGGLEKGDSTLKFRGAYLGQQSLTWSDLGKEGQVPHSVKIASTVGHVGTNMAGNYLFELSLLKEWGTGRWHLSTGADARVFYAMRAMEEEVQRAWLAGTSANFALDTRMLKNNPNWRIGGLAGAGYQFFQGFGGAQPTHMITLPIGLAVSYKDLKFSITYGRTFNMGQITKDIDSLTLGLTVPLGAARKPQPK